MDKWLAAGAGGFVGCARLRRGSRREHAPSARIPSNFEGENGMNLDWPRAREGARAELVLSGGSICERAQKSAHTNQHAVGRNEVLMTVPNRAKSVPTGTHANLERGGIFQGIW